MRNIFYTALIVMTLAAPAWSQCALCREAAAAYGTEGAKALNTAIVVLLAPAVAMFGMVYFAAFRGGPPEDGDRRDEDRD